MERIDLLWDAFEDCLCKAELRAEFDRLKAEVERLLQINQEANRNIWRLQSQLDKISEPYHYSRDKAEYPRIRHEGKADGCPICNPKCEHKNIGVEWESQNKRWCPDCHEWVEKPNHIHSDDSGIFWEGAEKDCPMCNPKPLTQCPECHGTKYINRVVSCADWELHPEEAQSENEGIEEA